MIPNWLLGKSKSKLQEILGGGGGGGTTYTAGEGIDITNHEISVDPLLMNDIEQTALAIPTKAAKTQISNTNILHNPWFQVNQRGVTSASETDVFLIDRWKTSITGNATGTFTMNSDGTITIANTSQVSSDVISLYQKRTDKTFDRLKGRKVTLSVMLADRTIYSGTVEVPESGVVSAFNNEDMAFGIDEMNNKAFSLHVYGGKTITVKALKLEVGEVSTLAMDTAPDMATELLKCQRYFVRLKNNSSTYKALLGIGQGRTQGVATNLVIGIPLPIDMIIAASVSFSQDGISYSASSTATGEGENATAVNTVSRLGHIRTVSFSAPNLTAGESYFVLLNTQGYIDFDAEL